MSTAMIAAEKRSCVVLPTDSTGFKMYINTLNIGRNIETRGILAGLGDGSVAYTPTAPNREGFKGMLC